jgi:RHS repeat-associated protein
VNSYTCSHRDITRAARSEKVTQPYRFAGSYQDPTGLRHLSVRYYDPTIGRFNSPDPPARRRPLPLRRGRPSQLKRP